MNHRKIKKERVEVLAGTKPDRRLLSKVPDPDFVRTSADRRGSKHPDLSGVVRDAKDENDFSARYVADFPAILTKDQKAKDQKIHVRVADISVTGVLLEVPANLTTFEKGETYFLRFTIPPGTIPEGLESKVKMDAKVVRTFIQRLKAKKNGWWHLNFRFLYLSIIKRDAGVIPCQLQVSCSLWLQFSYYSCG
jgi:hyaluronan synthase